MGLRIITGAMKSTPITEMEKTADLEPLETRREHKAALQGEKMKRLATHPLHNALQQGTKNRLKRRSLNHQVKDLQAQHTDILETNPEHCEMLAPCSWVSRKNLPAIQSEVPGLKEKGAQSPALQRALTLEMIQARYPKKHLDPHLHRRLRGERCQEWRKWCLHLLPRRLQNLPLRPSW